MCDSKYNDIAITCVLNVHQEGALAEQSFQSILVAAKYASRHGISTRILVVADRPCFQTQSFLDGIPLETAQVITHNIGDLSIVRNLTAASISSTYIAWLDGDDLWSNNWLLGGFNMLHGNSAYHIVHPELNLYFDRSVTRILEHTQMQRIYQFQDTLYFKNLWTSTCIARTDIYRDIPYMENLLDKGFGYEDWVWNMDTVRQGYLHGRVPGTVHGIRERQRTLSTISRQSGAIPKLLRLYQVQQDQGPRYQARQDQARQDQVRQDRAREDQGKQTYSAELLRSEVDKVCSEPCVDLPVARSIKLSLEDLKNKFQELAEFSSVLDKLEKIPEISRKEIVKTAFCHFRDAQYRKDVVWCVDKLDENVVSLLQMLNAERFASNSCLIIYTGLEEIDFKRTSIVNLSDYVSEFHRAHWPDVLHTIVGEASPRTLVNYDSNICAEMYQRYGRQLKQHCVLFSAIAKNENDRLRNNPAYLNRIRIAHRLDVEMIVLTPGAREDLQRAQVVTWSSHPRPDFWMRNELTLEVKANTIYSFDVYLPKLVHIPGKEIVVQSLRQSNTAPVVIHRHWVERGRRTTIEISPQGQTIDSIYTIQTDAEPGGEYDRLGFVLVDEKIDVVLPESLALA